MGLLWIYLIVTGTNIKESETARSYFIIMSEAKRKYTLYQRTTTRNIILTDNNPLDTADEIKAKLIKLMASKKVCVIQTQDDMIVFRPHDLTAILVSSKGEFNDIIKDTDSEDGVELSTDEFLEQLDEQTDTNVYTDDLTFTPSEDE